MGFSGSLEKMVVLAYQDSAFSRKAGEYTVMINPERYERSYEIRYNDVQAQGASGGSPDFDRIPSETLRCELVFDGTGVLPSALPGVLPFTGDGIAGQIESFTDLVFDYDGRIHSPRYLILVWGKLYFKCRLASLDLTYTLFKPDGTPLRARAAASFVSFADEAELALAANKTSPDLTHAVTVKAGDTLPLLCWEIYGSSRPYLEIARVNGLTDFRHLAPGTELLFPPLGDGPA